MPDRIAVNVPAYVGEYEFDLEAQPLTTLEWRWIKKISGYLPLTASEGFAGADPDLFVAWAVIAMVRARKIEEDAIMDVADTLARAPFDGTAISFIGGDVELDPLGEPSTEDAKPSSGESSSGNGATTPENLSHLPSGLPASDTGSTSVPETSAT